MGLVSELLLLPFTAPVRGFGFFLERIRDEAEAALFDEGRAFAELIDLSMRHNVGQLSDGEFAEQETALLERLNTIREYREELNDAELDADEEELLLEAEAEVEAEVEEEVR